MFGSSFLDTAIGIIFVFLLLSLIASTANEIILSYLNMRGRMLLEGIATLFGYTKNTPNAAKWMVDEIYNHGQVFGLFKDQFQPDKTKSNLPSYIPANNFAMAFLGGVLPKAAELLHTDLDKKASAAESDANNALQASLAAPTDTNRKNELVQAQQKADAARKLANTFTPDGFSAVLAKAVTPLPALDDKATLKASADEVGEAFNSLVTLAKFLAQPDQYPKVGKPLLAILATAENDVTKLKTNLEAWYNSAMDRVSGWYKYHTQWTLCGIGVVLAVSLNADTIGIVRQLSHDPVLRQSIVAAAQSAKLTEKPDDVIKLMDTVKTKVSQVEELGIPLGWGNVHNEGVNWLWIGVGWLLTAVAVSLGAPFWFDLLNKFMVVRSTFKPQEKGKEEGSKDKPTIVLSTVKP